MLTQYSIAFDMIFVRKVAMIRDIDLVVLWVNGDDPKWLEERRRYEPEKDKVATNKSRFRDWGLMRYWFRGVEKNVDWYRYIFFVTYGHLPEWLNLDNERLRVVKHEDFIPQEYLPTYNSNVIELNLHRIKDLSKNFVLFNDDIFIVKKVEKTYFFKKKLPCDALYAKVLVNWSLDNYVWHMVFNNMGIINRQFSGGKNNLKNFTKWVNSKYGKNALHNMFMMLFSRYSSFYDFHLPIPYDKDTFEEVWRLEGETLDKVCYNKFRTPFDISHWLFRYWRMVKGEFCPTNVQKFGSYYEFTNGIDDIISAIVSKDKSILVLNDAGCDNDIIFEEYRSRLTEAFEKVLSEKCSFEI